MRNEKENLFYEIEGEFTIFQRKFERALGYIKKNKFASSQTVRHLLKRMTNCNGKLLIVKKAIKEHKPYDHALNTLQNLVREVAEYYELYVYAQLQSIKRFDSNMPDPPLPLQVLVRRLV